MAKLQCSKLDLLMTKKDNQNTAEKLLGSTGRYSGLIKLPDPTKAYSQMWAQGHKRRGK